MTPLLLALALFAQDPAAEAAPPEAAPAQEAERWPAGAPREDYPFVAWCYGALRGYLDLQDEVMPEVTRIESTFRRPGSKLEDDLKVYADIRKDAQQKLKLFESALTAAEKASLRPINAIGADAVKKGRATWNAGPEVTTATKAQLWMSWAPPARCETTAVELEKRAKLMGTALQVNAEDPPEAPPAE